MNIEHLLAKSQHGPPRPHHDRLVGHTTQVVKAAKTLLGHSGRASLDAARIREYSFEDLSRVVRLAAVIHDLGKCSDHFQMMVRGKRTEPQLVRHEALSLWLAWPGQPLAAWLQTGCPDGFLYRAAVVAAAAHHRKFWQRACADFNAGAGTQIRLLVAHKDFADLLRYVRHELAITAAPPVCADDLTVRHGPRDPLTDLFEEWQRESEQLFPLGSEQVRLLAVAKALVIAADVAGSALPREEEKTDVWIDETLRRRRGRVVFADIVDARLRGEPPRSFQLQVGASGAPVTLVRAGCGSGKTVAAYLWMRDQHPARQLWVTYPTTGTATAGYMDYLVEPDVAARLEHMRASVDLEMLHVDGEDEELRTFDRLDALRVWGQEVIACTVDTVLGIVQNQRKGLYAWPSLCQGAVVFDEIHAYDDALFGALLRFLEALPGIPALLMTASLPGARLRDLESLVARVHGVPLAVVEGPVALETTLRYRIERVDDPWEDVRAAILREERVLWVCNTVERCIRTAERAAQEKLSPIVYHSRFRYEDRVRRHGAVIDAFKGKGPALAVTTQVAEMSLDLSADLLVSDRAPIPSLIQRLGRLNRHDPQGAKPCKVVPFDEQHPYERADLQRADGWIDRLLGRELHQRDLVDAWVQDDVAEGEATRSAWLDGRFETAPRPLREATPGVTVVLKEDEAAVHKKKVPVVRVALPMNMPPRAWKWQKWPTAGYLPVPPSECVDYDPVRGARWRKQ